MEEQPSEKIEDQDDESFVMELFGKGDFRELRHVSGITHKAERREFFKGDKKVADLFLNPETEEPEHGFKYDDDTGELVQFEDWKTLKENERKNLALIMGKPLKKMAPGPEEAAIGEVSEWLKTEQLPREDYGSYWIYRWITKDGMELAEYANKKTEVIEWRTTSKNGIPIGEIIYDKETGKLKEIKTYDKDGNIKKFTDHQTLSDLEEGSKEKLAEAQKNIVDNISPKERERLMTLLDIENRIKKEKIWGRDPDIKH